MKKVITVSSIAIASLFMTGCADAQPKVKEIKTINTTKEVLIPHNDNIKKAVVILISKVKELEGKVQNCKSNIKKVSNSNIEASKQNKQIIECNKKLKSLESLINKNSNDIIIIGKSTYSQTPKLQKEQDSQTSEVSEHDSIIKDFLEKDGLK